MKSTARFSVDPRLSALLGESYTSSERALRELVDNAWDAEARVVTITLPDILSDAPLVIEDDGHGMKNQEVRQEYLKIASPRFSRKGERTPNLDRKVKGRRGIGKFSGLTIGDEMEIVTRAQGIQTTLVISKELLLEAGKDIEEVDLPISDEPCEPEAHGTTITIRKLNPRLNFPQPDKLREQVAYDYGRESGFQVQINGDPVLRHDVQGTTFTKEYEMPDGTKAEATWTVTEKPLPGRKAGLIVRDFTDKTYRGKDAADRPDLLLAANVENRHLLLEFKRPSIAVGREAEHQAITYADSLTGQLGVELDILVVGGNVDPKLQAAYSGKKTRFLSYRVVIANARTQLEWLLKQLNEKP